MIDFGFMSRVSDGSHSTHISLAFRPPRAEANCELFQLAYQYIVFFRMMVYYILCKDELRDSETILIGRDNDDSDRI